MPVLDLAHRGQLDERRPVPVVRVRQACRRRARRADGAQAVRDAGILAHDHRIVRARDRLAVHAARERLVRSVEPRAMIMLATLVQPDRLAVRAQLRVAKPIELVARHADRMQRLRKRTPDSHDHAAEIHAHKLDGMP